MLPFAKITRKERIERTKMSNDIKQLNNLIQKHFLEENEDSFTLPENLYYLKPYLKEAGYNLQETILPKTKTTVLFDFNVENLKEY